jgi:hypothetical protein
MSAILGDSTAANRQPARTPASPFKPTSKPTSRKSLSSLPGDTSSTQMGVDATAKSMEETLGQEKGRKRAYSVGGVANAGGKRDLSPRSQARRTAVSGIHTSVESRTDTNPYRNRGNRSSRPPMHLLSFHRNDNHHNRRVSRRQGPRRLPCDLKHTHTRSTLLVPAEDKKKKASRPTKKTSPSGPKAVVPST